MRQGKSVKDGWRMGGREQGEVGREGARGGSEESMM